MAYIDDFWKIYEDLTALDFSDSKVKDLEDLITILNRDGMVRIEHINGSAGLRVDEFMIDKETLRYNSYYNKRLNIALRCSISKLNNLLQIKCFLKNSISSDIVIIIFI